MGQRAKIAVADQDRHGHDAGRTVLSIFPTGLGWFGMIGSEAGLVRLSFGHAGPDEVRRSLAAGAASSVPEADFSPDLRRRLEDYAAGSVDSFRDVDVAATGRTRFQRSVIAALRGVGYGETLTYGELAERAGFPRAARAVGRVMATNAAPLVIPCHRVLASGGELGGFSAPQGTAMKRRLLNLEGVAGL